MIAILIVLVGFLGVLLGFYAREVREYLKRIEAAVKVLVERKDKVEAQEIVKKKGMSFGAPMSMAELAEMEDEERIAAINSQM